MKSCFNLRKIEVLLKLPEHYFEQIQIIYEVKLICIIMTFVFQKTILTMSPSNIYLKVRNPPHPPENFSSYFYFILFYFFRKIWNAPFGDVIRKSKLRTPWKVEEKLYIIILSWALKHFSRGDSSVFDSCSL